MHFCVNCGRQLRDGDTCTCQQPKTADKNVWEQAKNTFDGRKVQKMFRKYWPFIAGGAAVIILVIVLCCTLGGSTYKTPVEGLVKTFINQETDLVKIARRLLPDFVEGDVYRIYDKVKDSGDVEDMLDDLEDDLKSMYDYLEDYYGRGMTVACEITDKDELSKRELKSAQGAISDLYSDYLEDVIDEWEDMDDDEREDAADDADLSVKDMDACVKALEKLGKKLEKVKVSKGYELTVTVSIEGKDEDDEYEDLALRVIKVNGDWMIDFTSLDDSSALTLIMNLF